MRILFSTPILLLLCGTLRAQEYVPSYGRELPGSETIAYPTQREAADAADADNLYRTNLDEWTQAGNRFETVVTVPFAWANRQVLLHVEKASAEYEIRVDGRPVAYNENGSSPAEFNLTRVLEEGANRLEIVVAEPSATTRLESWRESPAPALGRTWLTSRPAMYIRDITVESRRNAALDDFLLAEVGIVVKTGTLNPRTSRIHYELLTPDGRTAAVGHDDLTLDMRREDTLRFLARIPDSLQWSAAHPVRYTLRLKTQHDGRYGEYLEFRTGFRTVETRNGLLSINGEPVELRTVEIEPQIGRAEIESLRERGYNTLRLKPGPAPESLYDTCDSLGIYVIATAPIDTRRDGESRRKGGNPTNDPAWEGAFLERAEDAYHTTKLHPSVVAFELARRSSNGINLYETYLKMKRLDESRPFIYPDGAGEWNSDRLLMK
ncbi:MAG: hypothetical protein NC209_02445 [Alistipes sp.]|nr:hypothetical protein [Alistipes senegalensis]MCM1249988.1 hypothetical protein [Alistipes sp.]